METVKSFPIHKAPKKIVLKGDKRKPESAEHRIYFPGGSISVCRTSNNQYWAHIEVYTEGPLLDDTRSSAHGKIECIRIDTTNGVKTYEDETDHFAVLVSTKG